MSWCEMVPSTWKQTNLNRQIDVTVKILGQARQQKGENSVTCHSPEQSRCRCLPAGPGCSPSRTPPGSSSRDCSALSKARQGLRGVKGSENQNKIVKQKLKLEGWNYYYQKYEERLGLFTSYEGTDRLDSLCNCLGTVSIVFLSNRQNNYLTK